MTAMVDIIKPGAFGSVVAADSRRTEFDFYNEVLVYRQVPVDFVFLGDSITHWWELNAYFGLDGLFIVNRGIAGDVTEFALKRFDADVTQLKPKYVVIKLGINQYWTLDFPFPQDRRQPDDIRADIVADLEKMIARSQDNGIVPIVCSILPTSIEMNVNTALRNNAVREANVDIRALAERTGTIYVDYHSAMADEDGLTLRPGLANDGLHPHAGGYDVMAGVLRETLGRHGIRI